MNRATKNATRKGGKVVVPGPSEGPGGPAKFDGRANLGAPDRKAVTNREPSGKPRTATRIV